MTHSRWTFCTGDSQLRMGDATIVIRRTVITKPPSQRPRMLSNRKASLLSRLTRLPTLSHIAADFRPKWPCLRYWCSFLSVRRKSLPFLNKIMQAHIMLLRVLLLETRTRIGNNEQTIATSAKQGLAATTNKSKMELCDEEAYGEKHGRRLFRLGHVKRPV